MSYTWVKNCLACGNCDLYRTLDLGNTPLANSLLDSPDYNNEPTYPLEVMTCTECWHSQLSVSVRPEILFEKYDYVSGTTETLHQHFLELAGAVLNEIHASVRSDVVQVLDIAANDGSLCQAYYEVAEGRYPGLQICGVDPAKNLQIESFKKGIPVLVDYWSEKLGAELSNTYDAITACNVFAHNLNPLGFLKGCHAALADDGVLVIEMPYGPRFMLDFPTDGHYYHEHQNYFLVKSFLHLATRAGFWIVNAEERAIHGGSIRLWLEKATRHIGPWTGPNPRVQAFIDNEKNLGLYNLETYRRFENTLKKNWSDLALVLESYKKQGYVIVGYGASAKSATLLNGPFGHKYLKNPGAVIDFMVDDNPRKVGKFAPGTHIYIGDPKDLGSCLAQSRKMAFLNLVYNFKDEVVKNIKHLRPQQKDDILIEFVPKVRVSNLHGG